MTMFHADLLSGKVALVTGASSGLGRHFALLLARHGADVVVAARRTDALAALADEIGALGRKAHVVPLDVRDAASVEAALRDSVARAGHVDILVNNAGVALTKPALQTSDEEWRSVVDTNLDGAFRVARATAQAMADAKRGGAIVNIASILGLRVTKQVAPYIAAKAALLRLSEALALEWAMHGIRVNAIAPGYVETELNRDFLRSPAGESLGQARGDAALRQARGPRRRAAAAGLRCGPLHDRRDDHRRRRPLAGMAIELLAAARRRGVARAHRAFVRERILPLERDRANYDEHENIALDLLERVARRSQGAGLWAPQMPRDARRARAVASSAAPRATRR